MVYQDRANNMHTCKQTSGKYLVGKLVLKLYKQSSYTVLINNNGLCNIQTQTSGQNRNQNVKAHLYSSGKHNIE